MDTKEVKDRIKTIGDKAGDPECAHILEDTLYFDVLRAIADGVENPKKLAEIALKTKKIDFERWYA